MLDYWNTFAALVFVVLAAREDREAETPGERNVGLVFLVVATVLLLRGRA